MKLAAEGVWKWIRGESPRYRFVPSLPGLFELVLLFGALAAIEAIWFPNGGFQNFDPHPYWLPVLLLSLQYGTVDGLLAALIAIAMQMVMGWPSQGVEEEYYGYVVRAWAEPVGWILSAIIIGEIRARQRSRQYALETELAEAKTQAEDIADHCHLLSAKVVRLERDIASSETSSIDGAVAALAEVEWVNAHTVGAAFAEAFRSVVGEGDAVLAIIAGKDALIVARTTMPGTFAAEGNVRRLARPIAATVRARRSLSAIRSEDLDALGDGILFAAPLLSPPAGRVFGVLAVTSVSPKAFSNTTEGRVRLLARELSSLLLSRGYAEFVDTAAASERIALVLEGEEYETAAGQIARFGRA